MSKTAEAGPNKAGFVFGDSKEEGPNKVLGVMPVESFLVQYTDGSSRKCVRLVFKVPGAKEAFILQEKIQGSFVATAGTPWFNEALGHKLSEAGIGRVRRARKARSQSDERRRHLQDQGEWPLGADQAGSGEEHHQGRHLSS